MKKKFGQTDTEMEVLELLWRAETPLTFREIMSQCRNDLKKDWKKQTLNTYLSSLAKAGLIHVCTDSTYYTYTAKCTKEELIVKWTQGLVRDIFDDSVGQFMAAFTGGKKLSEKEIEELKKFL